MNNAAQRLPHTSPLDLSAPAANDAPAPAVARCAERLELVDGHATYTLELRVGGRLALTARCRGRDGQEVLRQLARGWCATHGVRKRVWCAGPQSAQGRHEAHARAARMPRQAPVRWEVY